MSHEARLHAAGERQAPPALGGERRSCPTPCRRCDMLLRSTINLCQDPSGFRPDCSGHGRTVNATLRLSSARVRSQAPPGPTTNDAIVRWRRFWIDRRQCRPARRPARVVGAAGVGDGYASTGPRGREQRSAIRHAQRFTRPDGKLRGTGRRALGRCREVATVGRWVLKVGTPGVAFNSSVGSCRCGGGLRPSGRAGTPSPDHADEGRRAGG